MSGSLNKVQLIGRLGKDPEEKFTSSGTPVTKFSIATDETWKDKSGEQQKRVTWHNIIVWNKLAEICSKYLVKGKQVYIEGKIQVREWEDRAGVKRTQFNIVAHTMLMIGSKGDGDGRSEPRQQEEKPGYGSSPRPSSQPAAASETDSDIIDEDIPF